MTSKNIETNAAENNKSVSRAAFISIVGRPNVGKSSLLNIMIGQKVAIVSSKPQTTRNRIMGVLTEDNVQLVFIDTPGMHKPKNSLGNYMVKSIKQSVLGVDCCLLVVQANKEISETELQLIDSCKNQDIPCILAINKIDLVADKSRIIELINQYSKLYDFKAVVPICAKNGDGVSRLKGELLNIAPESDFFFEEDTLTDQTERVLCGEIIREKLLRLLNEEIPHGTAVVIEKMKTRESNGIVDIDATIYTEKESHKGIIIGKKGAMLKKVGTHAREDMESFFQCKINLNLWVKVKEDWRNREGILRTLGYDSSNFD